MVWAGVGQCGIKAGVGRCGIKAMVWDKGWGGTGIKAGV